jgi:hypothetical protein
MTIEQKAKAYEDALKRAKAVIKVAQNQKEVYGCITTIFPELKESNDEKVIKALIRFHKSTIDIDDIKLEDYFEGYEDALTLFKEQFIDTLEVKDVDINKEISQFINVNFKKATIGHKLNLRRVAKHFFKLGLKVKKGE